MAGKNYGVFRRRPDNFRPIRKPITITTSIVAKAIALRLPATVGVEHEKLRDNVYYLRHTRRIKLVTITAPPIQEVLRKALIRDYVKERYDYFKSVRRVKPITITAPPIVPLLRQRVFRDFAEEDRYDYALNVRRRKPTTIEEAVAASVLFRRVHRDYEADKPRPDYFSIARRLKPITITEPGKVPVLKSTSDVYTNRDVFLRRFDYSVRLLRRIKPITITSPTGSLFVQGKRKVFTLDTQVRIFKRVRA